MENARPNDRNVNLIRSVGRGKWRINNCGAQACVWALQWTGPESNPVPPKVGEPEGEANFVGGTRILVPFSTENRTGLATHGFKPSPTSEKFGRWESVARDLCQSRAESERHVPVGRVQKQKSVSRVLALLTPRGRKIGESEVDRARIELATHGFSGRCSTN